MKQTIVVNSSRSTRTRRILEFLLDWGEHVPIAQILPSFVDTILICPCWSSCSCWWTSGACSCMWTSGAIARSSRFLNWLQFLLPQPHAANQKLISYNTMTASWGWKKDAPNILWACTFCGVLCFLNQTTCPFSDKAAVLRDNRLVLWNVVFMCSLFFSQLPKGSFLVGWELNKILLFGWSAHSRYYNQFHWTCTSPLEVI
jgi:hypothetical protein